MLKNLFLSFGVVMILSVSIFAAPVGKSSLLPYQDTVLLGCDSAGIYYVNPSSSVATAVRPANPSRKGIIIKNITGESHTVYMSTYAATSINKLYPIADGSEFADDTMPYTGVWYILGEPAISTSTVIVIEKW